MLAYRGSIAHGMFVPKNDPNHIDDVDLMGVVVAPAAHYLGLSDWGSRGTKEYKENEWDCVFYELRKFVGLLLQGNPNVVSLLWTKDEFMLGKAQSWIRLTENRSKFAGKHVYNAFAGYAHAQLEKMTSRDPVELREYIAITNELKYRGAHPNHKGECFQRPYELPYPLAERLDCAEEILLNQRFIREQAGGEGLDTYCASTDVLMAKLRSYQKKGENIGYLGDKRKQLVVEHGYDAKNAAHCIRLLKMAKEFLETGEMTVYRPDAGDHQQLLDIKAGNWPLTHVKEMAEWLFQDVKAARDRSQLPDGPDRKWAEEFLIDTLRGAL